MNQLSQPKHKQFPVRLKIPLANALDRVANETRLTKTEISRIAITKFLHEIEQSGIRGAMNEICSV